MRNAIFSLLLLLLAPCISYAQQQEKKFPQGVAVEVQALFCLTKEDAQVIADTRGEVTPQLQVLMMTGKCRQLSGVAVYLKEVYRNGDWAVWELTSGNIPTFYEATDWTSFVPPKPGQLSI